MKKILLSFLSVIFVLCSFAVLSIGSFAVPVKQDYDRVKSEYIGFGRRTYNENTYNENGLLSKRYVEDSHSLGGMIGDFYNKYDEDNNLIESEDGSADGIFYTYKYYYKNGNINSEKITVSDSEYGSNSIYLTSYTYNEKGYLEKSVRMEESGTDVTTRVFSYDSSGRTVEIIETDEDYNYTEDKLYLNQYRTTFQYDNKGNLSKKLEVEKERNREYRYETSYFYNPNNQLIKKVYDGYYPRTYNYFYDEKGQLTREEETETDSDVLISTTTYQYDNNRLVKREYNYGSKNGKSTTDYYYQKTNANKYYDSETGWYYVLSNSYPYTGKAVCPTVNINYGNSLQNYGNLLPGRDYRLKYSNNTNVGTASVTIQFINDYAEYRSVTLNFKIVPQQVTGLKASDITVNSVNLSWNKTGGAKYYKVEKFNASAKKWETYKTVSANTCTVSDLKASTKYQFRVTALDSTKKLSGAVSATLTAQTSAAPPSAALSKTAFTYNGKIQKPTLTVKDGKGKVMDSKNYTAVWSDASSKAVGTYTVKVTFKGAYSGSMTLTYKILPKQVTGVKASTVRTTSITLKWNKVTGAKYYKLEKYNASAKKWETYKTVSANTCTVSKLKAGTKYQFRVTALDSTKKLSGKASSSLNTQTLCAAPTIKLASTKSKTATVTVTKVTGAGKYIIYKSTDGKKWTKVTATTATAYNLTKLTGGKKIYVKVQAVNAYGKASAYSAAKSVTVKK